MVPYTLADHLSSPQFEIIATIPPQPSNFFAELNVPTDITADVISPNGNGFANSGSFEVDMNLLPNERMNNFLIEVTLSGASSVDFEYVLPDSTRVKVTPVCKTELNFGILISYSLIVSVKKHNLTVVVN